jgi:membrane fusion protein (multidrug efflux system)
MIKRLVLGGLALALLGLIVLRVVRATAEREPAPDVQAIRAQTGIPVEVAAAVVGPLEVRRGFTGVARGVRSATIRARTGDEIVDLPVAVGTRVRAGTVLVRQSSQGSMAAVRQAEAAAEQARRLVERLRPLKERGAISEQDWDDAQTGLRVAEANLAAARKSVVLTSPIDGIVTDVMVTRGVMPEAGDPLVRVSDLSRVQVIVSVSPEQARELALGQTALLERCAAPGRVTQIGLQADPVTRMLEVELTFPGEAAASVVPGALVTVEVVVGTREAALVVPQAAVTGDAVWIVDSAGVVHRRPVRVGIGGEGVVEIVEGVSAGEQVVVAGASLLSEGARVRMVGGPAS